MFSHSHWGEEPVFVKPASQTKLLNSVLYAASRAIYGIQNEYSQKLSHRNYLISTQIIFTRLSSQCSPSANTKLSTFLQDNFLKKVVHILCFIIFTSHFWLASIQSGFHTHYFTENPFFTLTSELLLQNPLGTLRSCLDILASFNRVESSILLAVLFFFWLFLSFYFALTSFLLFEQLPYHLACYIFFFTPLFSQQPLLWWF